MDTKVKGIVLNSKDFKESDKLLSILSLEKGKILVCAKGVKKQKAKFKAYAQPFCFADFELTSSKNGNSYVLTGAQEIENFYDLTADIDRFEFAFCVLEIADKVCREGVLYTQLFIRILKTLQVLMDNDVNGKVALVKYLLDVLNFEGVNLNFDKCTNCKTPLMGDVFLNTRTCEVLCQACQNYDCVKLEKSTFSTLKMISNCEYNSLKSLKIKDDFLDKALGILILTISNKFEIKIKSISFV